MRIKTSEAEITKAKCQDCGNPSTILKKLPKENKLVCAACYIKRPVEDKKISDDTKATEN